MRLLALILAADAVEAEQIRTMITAPDLAGVRAVLMELQPAPPPAPWWAGLQAGDHVRAGATPADLYSAPSLDAPAHRQAAPGQDLTLWAPARADGWLDVFRGKLWIRAEAVVAAP